MKHGLLKKINTLFDKRQKRRFSELFVLMFIGALLDTLSISLVVPLMFELLGSGEGKTLSSIIQKFIPSGSSNYLLIILTGLICLFLIKNLFLSFQYYIQEKFINSCKIKTRRKLMQSFLSRQYEYFLTTDSGSIIRLVNDDIDGTFILIRKLLDMSIEIIVSGSIAIALLIIEPVTSIMLVILLIIEIIIISMVLDPVSRRLSKRFKQHRTMTNTLIVQIFRGIKEIIVTQKKDYFLKQFDKHSTAALSADTKAVFLSSLPRNFIEAVTMSGMLAYIMVYYLMGNDVVSLVPKLSAFAVAAIRLIPSFNRISSGKNVISYNETKLDNVLNALKEAENENSAKNSMKNSAKNSAQNISNNISWNSGAENISFSNHCGLKNVTFSYKERGLSVLKNADMDIPAGKSVGIVGPSGSGKTTSVDILLGLLKPQEGCAFSDDKDINNNYSGWLDHIGYIPQTIFLIDSSIRENVAFGIDSEEIDEKKVEEALKAAALWDFVNTLPEGVNTRIGEQGIRLSGGQRQRIGIARALYTDPEILVFDEATSSLDNDTEKEIMESINTLHGKKTLVIIAHRLTTIENCDIIYRVDNEKIVREEKI